MYIPDLADADTAWQVASRSGRCGKRSTPGASCCAASSRSPAARRVPGGSTASARSSPLIRTRRSHRQPEPGSLPLAQIAQRVTALGLAFATVDLALRADGIWRVVEVGDGQVSGLPATTAAADLIAAIWPR